MTICIAAQCVSEDKKENLLILCTDWLQSSGLGANDQALKQRWLTNGFYGLTAGDDDVDINATLKHIQNNISQLKKPIRDNDVRVAVEQALYSRKNDYAENYIRSRYAMSYADFVDKGREKLPPDIFTQSLLQVRELKLKCEFIVAGMLGAYPLIIQTTQDFEAHIMGDSAAIGSGSYLAIAALLHRCYDNIMPLNTALYCVFEAKKYAERVPTVGKRTTIAVLANGQDKKITSIEVDTALEAMYKQHGPKELPPKVKLPDNLYF